MKKIFYVLALSILFVGCSNYRTNMAHNLHDSLKYSDEAYKDKLNVLTYEGFCFGKTSGIEYEYQEILAREKEAIDNFQKEKIALLTKHYLGE